MKIIITTLVITIITIMEDPLKLLLNQTLNKLDLLKNSIMYFIRLKMFSPKHWEQTNYSQL